MSHNQDGDSWGVYGQRYAADGAASGDEFLINTYTSNQQQEPSVTALNDGGFVVTWMSNGNDGSGWGYTASVMRLMARLQAMSS